MQDSRSQLALDVISQNGQPLFAESLLDLGPLRENGGDAVHKSAARLERGAGVIGARFQAAGRKQIHQDLGFALP